MSSRISREIKFDVTWSYVKRQTAQMTSAFVFFPSNPSLNHIKIEKMSPTIRHKYKYFHPTVGVMSSHDFADIMIFRFRFRAKDRRQKFHFCRLSFDVRGGG